MYFCYAMKHPSLTFCLCDVFTKKMVEYITCTLSLNSIPFRALCELLWRGIVGTVGVTDINSRGPASTNSYRFSHWKKPSSQWAQFPLQCVSCEYELHVNVCLWKCHFVGALCKSIYTIICSIVSNSTTHFILRLYIVMLEMFSHCDC